MQTKTSHNKPIYFVALESIPNGLGASVFLVTNTETSGEETGPDGFPVQYQQRINLQTGACTCACKGFQEFITRRAAREGRTPKISNERDTCKHIRKAAECGAEWGYLGAQSEPVETKPVFDYVAFFED